MVFTQRSGEAARTFEAETGSPRWFDAGRGARACVPKRLRSRSARAEHQPCGAFPDSVLPLTVAPDFTCSVASLGWCSGPQLLGNRCLRNRSLADHMSWLRSSSATRASAGPGIPSIHAGEGETPKLEAVEKRRPCLKGVCRRRLHGVIWRSAVPVVLLWSLQPSPQAAVSE